MKRAIMVSPAFKGGNKNIGDYVQAVAAAQFMPSHDYVNREALDEYSGEETKVILNGWFMHHPEKFPPSPAIKPLLVSFHLNPEAAKTMLTPAAVEWLKANGPVGCRDTNTLAILAAHGVDAYFSACLTLTLGRTFGQRGAEGRSGVCFVDPFYIFKKKDFRKGRMEMLRHPLLALKIYSKMRRQMLAARPLAYRIKRFFRIGAFLKAYLTLFTPELLANAEYFSHDVPETMFASEDEKMEYARKLVERYSRARYVVTTRIHCALPCVGMKTPVVFVNPVWRDMADGRFGGLTDFFSLVDATPEKLTPRFPVPSGRLDLDAVITPDETFQPYADALALRATRFVHIDS